MFWSDNQSHNMRTWCCTDRVLNQACQRSRIWSWQLCESMCASQNIPLEAIFPFSKSWTCWILLHILHTWNKCWCHIFRHCGNLECVLSNCLPFQMSCNRSPPGTHVFPYGQPKIWLQKKFTENKSRPAYAEPFPCMPSNSPPSPSSPLKPSAHQGNHR